MMYKGILKKIESLSQDIRVEVGLCSDNDRIHTSIEPGCIICDYGAYCWLAGYGKTFEESVLDLAQKINHKKFLCQPFEGKDYVVNIELD